MERYSFNLNTSMNYYIIKNATNHNDRICKSPDRAKDSLSLCEIIFLDNDETMHFYGEYLKDITDVYKKIKILHLILKNKYDIGAMGEICKNFLKGKYPTGLDFHYMEIIYEENKTMYETWYDTQMPDGLPFHLSSASI